MGLSIPSKLAMKRSIETQPKAARSRSQRKTEEGTAPQKKKTESRMGTLLWMEGWSDG